ncbi:DUF2214 family protein [Acetobacteraceae bacterium H6797]|nr:DUF2214 family protein [Acetobacteraceae bacterium H6797]
MLDLLLAIIHHLAAFSLLGLLCAQLVLLHSRLDKRAVRLLARLDIAYGIVAAAVLAAGFARAAMAAKGWEFYATSLAFWAKIAAFALIGLLSILPTLRFRQWRRAGEPVPATELSLVRGYVTLELLLFPLIPVFAALMARGFF